MCMLPSALVTALSDQTTGHVAKHACAVQQGKGGTSPVCTAHPDKLPCHTVTQTPTEPDKTSWSPGNLHNSGAALGRFATSLAFAVPEFVPQPTCLLALHLCLMLLPHPLRDHWVG